jgi:hypothetical protein
LTNSIEDTGESRLGTPASTADEQFVSWVNNAVSSHVASIMGVATVDTINFHLKVMVGADLSEVATNPALVEKGLRRLFGRGANVVIKAAIFAAFRSARLIPDKDYVSLEEAMTEMYRRRAGPALAL